MSLIRNMMLSSRIVARSHTGSVIKCTALSQRRNSRCSLGFNKLPYLQRAHNNTRVGMQRPNHSAALSVVAHASMADYYVLPIAGDGRCMFRALAQGSHLAQLVDQGEEQELLPYDQETMTADSLRSSICDELLARKDDIAPFIDTDFDQYVDRMRIEAVWGGEPELAVAPHVVHRPVAVFMKSRGMLGLVSVYGDEYTDKERIPLLFHGAGHYELLVKGDIRSARSKL